jgi:site-specific recombinase XerD
MNDQSLSTVVTSTSLDVLILGWLDAKFRRSKSLRTKTTYEEMLGDFRNGLKQANLDLDSQEKQDLAQIALLAQAYAGGSKRQEKEVSSSTYNLRLSVLSSFYEHAIKQDALTVNPIKRVERAKVQQYAHARALDHEDVDRALRSVDQSTKQGKRDYALLVLLLQTGRRLNEVVSLELQHLLISGGKIVVSFDHCKGGKSMRDALPLPVATALLEWLQSYYGEVKIGVPGDTRPVWITLARDPQLYGKPLGHQSVADVCQKHLGTSKVHVTRHTWARSMKDLGAPVSDIQKRLGHESLATTGRYLDSLSRDDNPYADQLAAHYGIK